MITSCLRLPLILYGDALWIGDFRFVFIQFNFTECTNSSVCQTAKVVISFGICDKKMKSLIWVSATKINVGISLSGNSLYHLTTHGFLLTNKSLGLFYGDPVRKLNL